MRIRNPNFTVDISNVLGDYYSFDFSFGKHQDTIDWFAGTWGEQGSTSGWWQNQYKNDNLKIIVKGHDKVAAYLLTWSP